MVIQLEGVSKRFTGNWIFKNLSHTFLRDKSYAISGPNGSGKSTLLLIISGWILPSEGTVQYLEDGRVIDPDRVYRSLDFASPYLELIEDLTLEEFIEFHFRFKTLRPGMTTQDFIKGIYLEKDRDKLIRHFSSGMKQRLKIGLGFYSTNPVLFLDEPTTNLDERSKNWFFSSLDSAKKEKLVILASNQPEEYNLCDYRLEITDFQGIST
jgi:ABC-type multidrug transport system ATPase subunit